MGKKNISILKNCYGCGVCSAVCPVKIIDMEENKAGFYSPVIKETEKCINCGLCLSVCSFHNAPDFSGKIKSAYAGWSKDDDIRHMASSGGVAYEMGRKALRDGYKYCGVKYDVEAKRASHYICDNEEDLKFSLGSKYIPSFTSDAFDRLLTGDKYIVFGAPCQIASLRLLLKKKKIEDRFILIDFYCHGVPSLRAWDKYVKSHPALSSAKTVRWRDKKNGWHDSYIIVASGEGGDETYRSKSIPNDAFYRFFLSHYALNKCCIDSCKFKKCNSSADIRIGDLWGKQYGNDEAGVSGIICLTERGDEFLKSIEGINLVASPETVVSQGQMSKNARKPWGYGMLKWLLSFDNLSLENIISIYRGPHFIATLPARIINKIKGR